MQLWFHKAIYYLPLDQIDFLFVENIGNLVCPSNYELDTHLNVILLSIPEREDKPENIFYFQNIRCVNVKEQIKNKFLFLCYKSFG